MPSPNKSSNASSVPTRLQIYLDNISKSGLTIYDSISVGDPKLWIPSPDLELILDVGLRGLSLDGLPIRTRSKVVKEKICTVLGYPIPKSFAKTQPRFPGQDFDTYVQKSNNLQIWNEELSPTRRYALIKVSEENIVTKVKVVTGDVLAKLDTTGTLTQKYQARYTPNDKEVELVSSIDTDNLADFTNAQLNISATVLPTQYPEKKALLPISSVFKKLSLLIGRSFKDAGHDQERNRGAELHKLVCEALGYKSYRDDGQFPDVRHQLIEVKLQTSPTIDLGLVLPTSKSPLDLPQIDNQQLLHCDVRYAVFFGFAKNGIITLRNLVLTTGQDFFSRFIQFQGKVLNKKLQIPLPADFFEKEAERIPD